MTSLKITKTTTKDKSSVKVSDVSNELLYNYYNTSTWRDFKVIPFSNKEIVNHLPGYKNVYETYKQVVQKYEEDMPVVEAYNG